MKKLVILSILLLISINSVGATSVKSFNTEIEVYNDGVAKVLNTLILDSTGVEETVSIPAYSPESVIVTDDSGELKFATLGNNILIKPTKLAENYEIKVQYLTTSLTSKQGDSWSIKYVIPAYKNLHFTNVEESGFILSLPNTATLTSFNEKGIVFMENNHLKAGRKLDLDEYKDTAIEAEYVNSVSSEKKDIIRILFFVIITVLGLAVLVVLGKLAYERIAKSISKGKKDIMKTLEKREAEIIELLLKNENKLYQSKIQKDTSISKATLSRIIKRLENRNVIEVRPSGNTNLILLSDWFVKK